MRDPNERAGATRATRAEVCDQIGRTMSTLWQRRSGVRPASVSTEYVGDVVRCEIRLDETPRELAGDGAEDGRTDTINSRGYEHGAQTAVERLTGRTVRAFIVARDEEEPTTNAFILEPVRVRH